MTKFTMIAILGLTAFAVAVSAVKFQQPSTTQSQWEGFLHRFNKHYASPSEYEERRLIFFARHDPTSETPEAKELRRLQHENPHASFGVTKFSDWTVAELDARRLSGGRHIPAMKKALYETMNATTTASGPAQTSQITRTNWSDHGVLGPVLNQKDCGGCWAFASAENIAAQWALAGHEFVLLSVQQLVSCDTKDFGCGGSYAYQDTLKWIKEKNNGTLATWASYPYTSGDGKSHKCADASRHLVVGAHGIVGGSIPEHPPRDPHKLANYVYNEGPVQISVTSRHLSSYSGGIISHGAKCQMDDVDHEVQLTGFDFDHSPPYWIIKNSWGSDWGEAGYYRVAIDKEHDLDCVTSWPWMFQVKATGSARIKAEYLAKRDAWNARGPK